VSLLQNRVKKTSQSRGLLYLASSPVCFLPQSHALRGLPAVAFLHVIWPLSFIVINYSSLQVKKVWNSTSICFRSRVRDRNNFLQFKADCVRSENRAWWQWKKSISLLCQLKHLIATGEENKLRIRVCLIFSLLI